ncbi:hypothetical protein SK128_007227 [Halocaridina rubra]|uniref:Large ribosomal subunit protein uL10m n=1 Tax=Halocaridina rubra TaxID=373956 RepID=A0AAN8XUK5_HALRR
MSWLMCGRLFQSNIAVPLVQTLRHRSRRPNLRRPAVPHWQRAVILKVTQPQYLDISEDVHPAEICKLRIKNEAKQKEVNPFEQILAREFLEKTEAAKVIAIFHRNAMTEAELYAVRLQLNKIGLHYQHYNNNIARLAFTGTKYEALLQLYQSQTATFIGDDVKIAKLLKMGKKFATLTLMAGVLEGRLMSKSDLQGYAALPSIHTLQGQLVGILNAPLRRLSQNLTFHQTALASSLNQYMSDKTKGTTKNEDT